VPEYKVCVSCGTSRPATSEHFHKSKDGLHAKCRRCRNTEAKGQRGRKRNKQLDAVEKRSLKEFIRVAKNGGSNIPHSSELLEVLMEYFGGVRGFSNMFVKQYYDAPVGGAFRTKMLDSLVRLVVGNTAMGGAKKPLELMSEEELLAESRRQILEAAMSITVEGKVEHGEGLQNLPLVEPPALPAVSADRRDEVPEGHPRDDVR
jgi:hypothetical protein